VLTYTLPTRAGGRSSPQSWALLHVCRRLRRAFLRCVAVAHIGAYQPRAPHKEPSDARRDAAALLGGPLRACPRLRHVTLGCCAGIADADIVPFARAAARNVASLTLQACQGVTDAAAVALATDLCSDDFHELELVCHPYLRYNRLTDSTLVAFANLRPHIRTLRVWMWDLRDHGASAIAAMKHLSYLKLRGVSGLTDARFAAIAAGCPNLTHLHLANAPELTDAIARAIADGPAGPSLTSITLTNNPNISDQFLVSLAQKCYALEEIHLSTCSRITDRCSSPLRRMPNLRSIALVNTRRVTSRVLEGIYRARDLETLTLEFCSNLTSEHLVPISRLPRLAEIRMGHCQTLGLGVARVLAACPALRVLDLSKTAIDDEAFDLLISGAAASTGVLRHLNVRHCPNVSLSVVQEAAQRLPHLTIVSDRRIPPEMSL
jgi:Leucine Rich repeat